MEIFSLRFPDVLQPDFETLAREFTDSIITPFKALFPFTVYPCDYFGIGIEGEKGDQWIVGWLYPLSLPEDVMLASEPQYWVHFHPDGNADVARGGGGNENVPIKRGTWAEMLAFMCKYCKKELMRYYSRKFERLKIRIEKDIVYLNIQ